MACLTISSECEELKAANGQVKRLSPEELAERWPGVSADTIRFYERIEPADVVVEDNRWLLTLP